MRSVHSTGTRPERQIEALLRRNGFRAEMHPKGLAVTPDALLRESHLAVFMHGCFWHSHANCKRAGLPRTNKAFWRNKLTANRIRDKRAARLLRRGGFGVLTIWACQLKDEVRLLRRLQRAVRIATERRGMKL